MNTGLVAITPTATEFFKRHQVDPLFYVSRHAAGDWTEMTEWEAAANKEAIEKKRPVVSSYMTPAGKIFIITETDKETNVTSTRVLPPEEY